MKSIRTIIAVIAVLIATPSLFAQAGRSDVGVAIVGSSLTDTTIVDAGDKIKFDFDEKTGLGLSFNRYWTDQFSTEVALQNISADLKLSEEGSPITFNVGKLEARSITAMGQWHFMHTGRFQPYVGAGVAHMTGEFKFNNDFLEPGDDPKTDLESKTTWTASVGANIPLTRSLSLGTEFKYIPWSTVEKGGSSDDSIDVDPLTFAVALKWRF